MDDSELSTACQSSDVELQRGAPVTWEDAGQRVAVESPRTRER
jgi:hypothetical protein